MDWQPIATAPRTGETFLVYWDSGRNENKWTIVKWQQDYCESEKVDYGFWFFPASFHNVMELETSFGKSMAYWCRLTPPSKEGKKNVS